MLLLWSGSYSKPYNHPWASYVKYRIFLDQQLIGSAVFGLRIAQLLVQGSNVRPNGAASRGLVKIMILDNPCPRYRIVSL